jgi:hypothetical protein
MGHLVAWWSAVAPSATPILALYAAIVSTVVAIIHIANLIHNKRTFRLDREPRLTVSQEPGENDLPVWRVQNEGRVDVFVQRLGVLVWSGWGLARWWGRRRAQAIWFDPPYVGWPPVVLVPGDALEVEAPCDELLLALPGTGLKGWVVVQPNCEDKRRRRYHGDPELSCISPQLVPWWQPWRRSALVGRPALPELPDAP